MYVCHQSARFKMIIQNHVTVIVRKRILVSCGYLQHTGNLKERKKKNEMKEREREINEKLYLNLKKY